MTERFSKLISIQHVIEKSTILATMPPGSPLLSKLDHGIKSLLGGQLANHCQIGKIDNHILVYYVDSPVWAYTFRMAKTQILSTLNALGAQYQKSNEQDQEFAILATITDIHIRVRPSIYRKPRYRKPRRPLPKLSASVVNRIIATAATLTDQDLARQWHQFGEDHKAPEP